jgi:BirA family biotin operon repressor/biotin-[acetyl-CoA-carboxylase] ligase
MTYSTILNPWNAPVRYYDTVASTMDECRALASRGEGHGTVVVADYQEAGRGRMGRSWKADRGKNLFFTVLLRYPDIPSIPQALTLRTGLAVSLAIEDFAPALKGTVRVKWPNDIMLDSRKAVGILTETDGKTVYIGIGVNAAQTAFPGDIAAKATSILLALQARQSPAAAEPVPEAWRAALLERILAFLHRELISAAPWQRRLEERLYMKGRPVRFIPGGADSLLVVEGVLAGLGEGGELLIVPEGGTAARAYVTGELQVYDRRLDNSHT